MTRIEKSLTHPSTKPFSAEGQTQKDLLHSSLSYINVGSRPPNLITIVGPNRSGTTALAEVFARLGIPNYLQPIKSIRRALEDGDEVPIFALHQHILLAVHKETLGSSREAEFFNPLESLLAAGYPAQKIQLIAMLRNPALTLTSWNRIYRDSVDIDGLVRAFQCTKQVAAYARSRGIPVIHYVHEMVRDNPSEMVARHLFRAVGISGSDTSTIQRTVDWSQGPRFGSRESTGVFYDRPPEIFVEGVKTRAGYEYNLQQSIAITESQRHFLREHGLYNLYSRFAQQAVLDTGLSVSDVHKV